MPSNQIEMDTPTSIMKSCLHHTATYLASLPNASSTDPWQKSNIGIWAGSIAAALAFLLGMSLAIARVVPARRKRLFEMDEKVLEWMQKELRTPQEQWRLKRMVEERNNYARWLPLYLWWAFWHAEPPMPPIVIVSEGQELVMDAEELKDRIERASQSGWTLQGGSICVQVDRSTRFRNVSTRRWVARESPSWHDERP